MNNNTISINNQPHADELWSGIGGHFDNLGQIINEFLDNSISNFNGNTTSINRNIVVCLKEICTSGNVTISIEDSGTGIKNLDEAFRLGSQEASESPLNEHGFGLKHALASADPDNANWVICTRTEQDVSNGNFKKICAPYKIDAFTAEICDSNYWPGKMYGTGTYVSFTCSRSMYNTLGRGIKGGVKLFKSLADILCEDIGFVYAGIIKENKASISLVVEEFGMPAVTYSVGAVTPDWADFINPGSGVENYDLGSGKVDIIYSFGSIRQKSSRIEFDNRTTRKYYLQNMSSSGVEIRINGRVLCYNLFKEIWNIEKHNSYNHLLVTVDICSKNKDALPKTRTSKNGLREGDERLENLYAWIKSIMSDPPKDTSLSDHETDLFAELKKRMDQYNPDPNKVIEVEKEVFVSSKESKDRVRIDMYEKTGGTITIYEGKKEYTTSKDVYQLRMYWDGLVYDGIKPNKGILVADNHPDSVKDMIRIVNTMKDANGNPYCLESKTWENLGITRKKIK